MSEEAAQGWIKRLRQWLMPMPWRRPGIENELLESEARFRKLFEDSADATLEWVARDAGCQFIQALGRKGFRRKRKSGEIEGVLISKKLSSLKVQ